MKRPARALRRLLPLSALFPLLLAVVAGCRTIPGGSRVLGVDPAVVVGRLDNGLVYYVRANSRPENTAELRLVVNAGSALEDGDQRGMAHMVEHLAFDGTAHFPENKLIQDLESMGIEFGPEINAYTSFDETVYRLQVPTRAWEALDTGLRILADWSAAVSFEDSQIRKERGVIVEEWRVGRGAEARIRDRQLPILLAGSRYADRQPIGLLDVIEHGSADRLRDFYRQWYRPDLMAVIAVGDFDARRVESRIRELFAPLAAPPAPRERPRIEVPDHEGLRFAIAADAEATASRVALYVKRPIERVRTAADYRRSIVESLFTGMLNDRLDELASKPASPLLDAGSARTLLVRGLAATYLGGRARNGEIAEALESLLTEAERVRRFGFTESELARQKRTVMSQIERLYAERENTPSTSYVREYTGNYLNEETIPGIESEHELYVRYLPGIKLREVNALASDWVSRDNATLMVSGPEKAGMTPPAEAELAAIFDRVPELPLEPYRDRTREAPLVAALPEPARVVEERRIEPIGVTYWRLGNGAQVYLKPTDFRRDEVLFEALSPGGSSLLGDDDAVPAATAVGALQQGGLGPFSKVELEKRLAGRQVTLTPYISEIYEGMEGSSSAKDLETLLQLVYLSFTAPRADPEAFRAYAGRLREQAATRSKNPDAVFWDAVRLLLANRDSRAEPLTAERLEALSLERSLAIYRQRFAYGGDFTFVLVGSFDPEALRPLVERYLGGLPPSPAPETWRDRGVAPPPGRVEETVRLGIDPVSRVQYVFAAPFRWSREGEVRLEALAGMLENRLVEVLRGQNGGTYNVGVFSSTSRMPRGEYRVFVGFGCDPARVEELSGQMFDEIRRLQAGEIDADALAKEKEILRRNLELGERTNSYWADGIATALRRKEDPADLALRPALIDALDLEAISAAARASLSEQRFIRVVLLPAAAAR